MGSDFGRELQHRWLRELEMQAWPLLVVKGRRERRVFVRVKPRKDLPRFPLGLHLAIGEFKDSIGVGDQARIMGDDQHHRAALAGILGQELDHLLAVVPVEGRGGFVGEDEAWVLHQRPADGDALFLAAREFGRPELGLVREPELAEDVVRAGGRRETRRPRPT